MSNDLALIQHVLGQGSIEPAFQPIVDMSNGKISSFEVLARWRTADGDVVAPDEFIPVLEEAGLLQVLTNRLMTIACRHASGWAGQFRLSFNAAPAQFSSPDFVREVRQVLAAVDFPPERIQIEITESAILDGSKHMMDNVADLKRCGIRILIDDFGTGYSSLTRLQAIPFDKIKIDASFIQSIEHSRHSRKIVSAVIGLGHSLGMSLVAEGLETEGQLSVLRQLGCDFVQGYYYSRPVFETDAQRLVETMGSVAAEPKSIELSCDRRLAELECLYISGLIPVCFVDLEGRMLSASKRFCDVIGVAPITDVNRFIFEVLPQEADFWTRLRHLSIQAPASRLEGILVNTPRGITRMDATPVFDGAGDVIGMSLIAGSDISTFPTAPFGVKEATEPVSFIARAPEKTPSACIA